MEYFWTLLFLLLSFYFIKYNHIVGNRIDIISPPAIATSTEITPLKKNIVIEKIKESIFYDVMKYLSIPDTFKLRLLSKSIFKKMFGEVEIVEGKCKITKVCSINIPENLFPHVAIIFSKSIWFWNLKFLFPSFLYILESLHLISEITLNDVPKNSLKTLTDVSSGR